MRARPLMTYCHGISKRLKPEKVPTSSSFYLSGKTCQLRVRYISLDTGHCWGSGVYYTVEGALNKRLHQGMNLGIGRRWGKRARNKNILSWRKEMGLQGFPLFYQVRSQQIKNEEEYAQTTTHQGPRWKLPSEAVMAKIWWGAVGGWGSPGDPVTESLCQGWKMPHQVLTRSGTAYAANVFSCV